ncbi:glycogen synthase (ADP-glucose) [Hydrogenispora ethanolica]|uniref:Glycogen synthase n=1 Tax=Hydrogenispora ethanolica TaxID=1082276 RepID=A0A4R1S7D1_HYDET|nr:glycogen/starch synthase [Hydrogenispora ethanolica]TCL75276.1 glycogen synthase (ADP-glucose) [Hydrogenispora ethanolica]
MSDGPLKILLLSAEVVPFAKTGGLADVAGALPKALKELGHDVRVAMPRYGFIDKNKFNLQERLIGLTVPMNGGSDTASVYEGKIGADVPVYMIDNPKYFDREGIYMYPDDADRFVFFSRGAMEMLKRLDWAPDILHCNDWHTAIVPNWLKSIYKDDPFFARTASIYTIHNLAYQGVFGYRVLEIAGVDKYQFMVPPGVSPENQINMMGRGIFFADLVNTVSDTYAQEILTSEYGEGYDWLLRERRDRLYGIVNGIDYESNNPAADPHIFHHYDLQHAEDKLHNKLALQKESGLAQEPHTPLIGMISRLSDQKGFDLIGHVIEAMMANLNFQFILLGTGAEHYHNLFHSIQERFPSRSAVYLTFNSALAQKIYAASDLFLMPSRFEPCGLGQLIALRYGSIPIVRETGGLKDTVQNYDPQTSNGNGFTFRQYDALAMYTAIVRAIETYHYPEVWKTLIQRAMSADFSWRVSAAKYIDLYHRALALRADHPVPDQYANVPG